MLKDYYQVLEVDADADIAAIKSSYRRLAKKYHPDLNPSHDSQERMKALTEAYSVLGDSAKRAVYDRKRIRHYARTTDPSSAHAHYYDTPPPRESRKDAYAKIKISESLVADATRLARVNLILTSSLLQRRFGLDYDHAAKLFSILIRRGLVDEDGKWTAKAKHAAAAKRTPPSRSGAKTKDTKAPPPPAGAKPSPRATDFRISESLLTRAVQISKTNYMLSVPILKQRLELDQDRAARLYVLLQKRGWIDEYGVWTDEARKQARGKHANPSTASADAEPHSARMNSFHASEDPERLESVEEYFSHATELSGRTRTLSLAFLQRHFDLDAVRAARLFQLLVKRGVIDSAGHWTEYYKG